MDTGKSILIVDDEPKNTQIIKDLLEFEGYRVRMALNGREALDLIRESPMDLVITDYEMPVMDGFELLRALTRGYPDLPVIMLTGQYREDMEKAIATLKEGAYDYLTKPVDLSKLRRTVITALNISETRKESRTLTEALEKAHAELNRKNEKLEELTRITNDLLTIISGDLEAPLTILTGTCKLLLKNDSPGLSEPQKQQLEMIGRQGEKIQGIVNDLLDLARVDTGHIQLNKVETTLYALLDKCRQNLQPAAADRGVRILLQPPPGFKPIFADEARMKQALFNLIHQAILFSDRDRTVRIGVLALPQARKVEVLFHSTTFPYAEIERLLRGDDEISGLEKQARYRLSLCREIIELHEGKLWVEEGVEGEIMFCLRIPIIFVK